MKITFTTAHKFSLDGVSVLSPEVGDVLDLEQATAERLVKRGVAKLTAGTVQAPKPEAPKAEPKPENKAEQVPANKRGRPSKSL